MKIALVTLTSLIFAGSAFAADGSGEDHRAKFQELDTDSSMTLSQEEFEAAGDSQKFSQYDLDGNGEVTQEEFLSVKGAKDRRDSGETSHDTGWGSDTNTSSDGQYGQ